MAATRRPTLAARLVDRADGATVSAERDPLAIGEDVGAMSLLGLLCRARVVRNPADEPSPAEMADDFSGRGHVRRMTGEVPRAQESEPTRRQCEQMEGPDDAGVRGLPVRARWLIAAVMGVAVAAAVSLSVTGGEPPADLWLLVVLGLACATASLVEVLAPGSYSLQPNVVFFAWGMVSLPVWALVVLATICFAPAVLVRRARWHKTAFNWGDYVLAGARGTRSPARRASRRPET